ncbi:MAG TPA: VWA domain-containing protein [Candidatus Bilamarchaeaceae archaeon]|nr:VWA domain-containing protein [Candidatus Bilamarchaeaceae archaeon]
MTGNSSKLFLLFLTILGLVSAGSYLIIMDASYSMDDSISANQTKLEAAKEAAIDFVETSQGNEFALMKFHSCNDGGDYRTGEIRVVRDLTSDKESLRNSINSVETGPYTPIAEAIAEGRNYIKNELKGKGTIILITDGEENCDGDPVLEANKTFSEGIAVINVVSYAIDQKEIKAMETHKEIAKAGGGKYYTAQTKEELKSALEDIKKEQSTCGLGLALFGLIGLAIFFKRN